MNKKERRFIREFYLAGGCYWGAEKYLSNIPGVLETEVGFANGDTHYPTYKHSWLVEGIADYGRGVFGINNEACNWSLPAKCNGGEIKSGYRVTAAFLKFEEENYRKDFVDVCHKALREETFTMDLFKEATGLTADELWEAYKNA